MKKIIFTLSIFIILLFSSCDHKHKINDLIIPDDPTDLNNTQDGDAFVYAKKRYKGKTTVGSGDPKENTIYSNLHTGIKITKPTTANFEADGYFELEGLRNDNIAYNYILVKLSKDGKESTYFLKGNFKTKIWLRFGKGIHKVQIIKLTSIIADLKGKGDIRNFGVPVISQEDTTPLASYEFTVNNTRDEDGTFCYPSCPIQSDSRMIYNLTSWITKDKTNDEEKIKAIHDFVIKFLHYDNDSLESGKRKKQDAISTFYNKTGVCEGYTSLMVAMLRSIGYKAKAIAGEGLSGGEWGGHAWLEVKTGSKWKFIDPTWDDPTNMGGDYVGYDYFYLDETPVDHTWKDDRPGRSIESTQPQFRGYPNGWY